MPHDLAEAWQSLHDAMGAAKPNCMVFVSPWALRRVLDEQQREELKVAPAERQAGESNG